MAKQWLLERWKALLPALEQAAQEEEIARLCHEELAAWREREMNSSSLRVSLTATRNQIRRLPLTDRTGWVNPRTRAREHVALKYLNFSPEEWRLMDTPSQDRVRQRMEQVQLLDQPDAIVARAEALLSRSSEWQELVVGLAAVTGRRLSELLKVGQFYPKQPYTVLFSGQLKQKAQVLLPYEIPTLCRADLVLDALSRLRCLLDCSKLEVATIGQRYSPLVREAAHRHFADLIPLRPGSKTQVYVHLERSVYAAIAVYYYCPSTTVDLHFLSHILGHYWVEREGEEAKADYAATLHYFDYRIGDGAGGINKRQGIKLGEPGVTILDAFAPKEQQEKQVMRDHQRLALAKATKTGVSRPHVSQQTMTVIKQIEQEIGVRDFEAALQTLVKEHYLYQQQQSEEQHALRELIEDVKQSGVENPVAHLRGLLEKDHHFKAGMAKRYSGVDYQSLSVEQLAHLKTPEASHERFRRALEAIMRYNAATEPIKRWYINQSSVNALVGGRKTAIGEYLDEHRQQIDAHHQQYGVTPAYNRKPLDIKEVISL